MGAALGGGQGPGPRRKLISIRMLPLPRPVQGWFSRAPVASSAMGEPKPKGRLKEPRMFSKPTIAAIAVGLAIGAPALANENDPWRDDSAGMSAGYDYDYARVTHVEPRMRQVRVSVPRRECYEVSDDDPGYSQAADRPAAGGMILGGLIGAVIGHQIGHGRERAVGTVAGAVISSAIGHDAAKQP